MHPLFNSVVYTRIHTINKRALAGALLLPLLLPLLLLWRRLI